MLPLVTYSLVALLLSLVLTPLCRIVFAQLGWLDQPSARKVHLAPIPRTGGIAIFLAYAAGLGLLLASPLQDIDTLAWALPGIRALLPAIFVIFFTGLIDDLIGLKPWMKIVGQVVAAVMACHAGVQMKSIASYHFGDTWWAAGLTIGWLVLCTNAFNLIDGLDGLAAGVGLFAAATALFGAWLNGNIALAIVIAPLLGALLGFLPYNFNPASIFMGDCGSLTVGFLLGCFGIIWSQKSATLLGMTAPLIALALPLLDTVLAVARRFLRRKPIFAADSGHIHHRLLAQGFTTRRVVYLLYAFAGAAAAISLLLSTDFHHCGGVALLAFCAIVWLAIHRLRYEEFNAAGHLVFGGLFRRVLNSNLCIRQLEQDVTAARTPDDCWNILVSASRRFGFSEAALQLRDRRFDARLDEADPADCWSLGIPLNGSGRIDLSVPFRSTQPPSTISLLAVSLRTVFTAKVHEFENQNTARAKQDLTALSAAVRSANIREQAYVSEYQS